MAGPEARLWPCLSTATDITPSKTPHPYQRAWLFSCDTDTLYSAASGGPESTSSGISARTVVPTPGVLATSTRPPM